MAHEGDDQVDNLCVVLRDSMMAAGIYKDFGTKARALLETMKIAKQLVLVTRCCLRHRVITRLQVVFIWCLRQYTLRVHWRVENVVAGTTIKLWWKASMFLSRIIGLLSTKKEKEEET